MPRPVSEQKTVVAPVNTQPTATPQLGVYAPLDGVRAAAPQSPLTSLMTALQTAMPGATQLAADHVQQQAKDDTSAGTTDAELAQVDPERLARSTAYADAVHKVNVLKQYRGAEAQTTEWAATNLDASAPFTDQVKAIDGQMKAQLGGLAKDPKAAAVIAPLYGHFITNTANRIVAQQADARQNEALDTIGSTIAASLAAGGNGDYAGSVDTLTHILGDRTEAVKRVVGMYIDHAQDVAAKGGDWQHVFDSLPTSIKLKDGTTIPGPGRSPALHDAIVRGKAAAQEAFNAYMEPQRSQQQLDVMTHLDSVARHGGLITEEALKPYITPGPDGQKPLLSAEQAASYIDRARDKAEELAKERAVRSQLAVTPDWYSLLNQVDPTDPKGKRVITMEDIQRGFDQRLSQATKGFTSPDTIATTIAATRQYHGLISTNLKAILRNAANRSAPLDAVKMLPAYEALDAAGQASLYLTPDDRLFYENLRQHQQAGGSEASAQALFNDALKYNPEQRKQWVDDNMPALTKQVAADARIGGGWITSGDKLSDYTNAGQVMLEVNKRGRRALLDTQGNVSQASANVIKSLQQDYHAVTVQGQKLLLPRVDARSDKEVQDTLDIVSQKVIPEQARRAGVDPDKVNLGWQVYEQPGIGPMLQVVDKDTGLPIDAMNAYPLEPLLREGNKLRIQERDKELRAEAAYRKRSEPERERHMAHMGQEGRGA